MSINKLNNSISFVTQNFQSMCFKENAKIIIILKIYDHAL